MAWTTPKTDFAPGDILTAAQMNAIGTNLDAIGGAWTSFTPTWTNLTVGNGTNESAYVAAGKTYFVRIKFTFGSTSAMTGTPEFTLPGGVSVNGAYHSTFMFGFGGLKDASAGSDYGAELMRSSSTAERIRFLAILASGTYASSSGINASVPFTWATGDILSAHLTFEAA